jgi:uroporphyrinogen decarboxylase
MDREMRNTRNENPFVYFVVWERSFMNSRERLLAALDRRTPDRLPVTTHHLMPSFLAGMEGIGELEFFDRFGLDAIRWIEAQSGNDRQNTAEWRIEQTEVPGHDYRTTRYRAVTPRGTLSAVLQYDGQTDWVRERLIKEPRDLELLVRFAPVPSCDVERVNREADSFGTRGIVRAAVPGFPIYGQPGCWQDAAVLFGIEALIVKAFDDPGWVMELLGFLQSRKLAWLHSARGARFDLLELGGGGASSSVISPALFDRFVAPFDAPLIAAAHQAGRRIVYHTCGGMMPILERIADMRPDAMETFTPRSMGGDADLGEAKRRVGHRACMIGGFDQFHHLVGCTAGETRRAVRRCFEQAGPGGGYILAPSDHFFEAEAGLLRAYADEARSCVYSQTGPAFLSGFLL